MKVLTRYLLRAHLGPFLFAFLALTGVILINTVARQLATLAGKGLPTDVILQFFVLSLPANIALTLPMAVLVSVLYTFSQLTAENEIAALKASGIDLRRIVLPVFLGAALLAGGMAWFNDSVLPEANHQWRQLMVDVGRKSPLFTLREQTINPIRTADGMSSYYLQAAHIDPNTSQMWDVVIYDVSTPRIGRTIYADSGVMAFNASRTDLLLRLYDGHLHEVSFDEPENFQRLAFQQQLLRMQGVGNELERQTGSAYRGDREMTAGMLQERIDTLARELNVVRDRAATRAVADLERVLGITPAAEEDEDTVGGAGAAGLTAEVAPSAGGPDYTRTGTAGTMFALNESLDQATATRYAAQELRSAQDQTAGLQRQIREFRVEIQKKWSIAAAALVFVLVGAPLALRFPRGGIGMVIAFSLAIFALYYVGLIGGETLADEGYVAPEIAMWGMNAIFAILGIIGFMRMGRETSTARGGGFGDWFRALAGAFGRRNPPERAP
ncbi:MAG TPA: LptF/LptG family permease [Longimicrobiaceae bacterium]|nr:LptF/LptG family permease [Longimicrobiaceae bacterium]